MRKFARIQDGIVFEFYEISSGEISDYFSPELIWAEVTDKPEVMLGWVATEQDGEWRFAEYVPPPPTDEEISQANIISLQQHTQLAAAQKTALTNRVGTLQDAADLEMATPEEVAELPVRQSQLLAWKKYAIFLGRVTAQDGWALVVEWPVKPPEGMDLTVSAVAGKSAETK